MNAEARRKAAVRLDAEAAASDPDDLAEACHVRAEMDTIASIWDERAWRDPCEVFPAPSFACCKGL